MPNMYQIPNQINRPPPIMNADNDMGQPRNFWMQNPIGNDPMMHDEGHQADQFSGPPPINFLSPNRGNFQSPPNFRGVHRGGKFPPRMSSPYNPNFRGGGSMNNRGRGGPGGIGLIRGGFMRGNGRGGPW